MISRQLWHSRAYLVAGLKFLPDTSRQPHSDPSACDFAVRMPPKEPFKPKPNAKSEKNKPKGGKAKDEKRAADKAKKEAKAGGGGLTIGGNKK